jgi:hypothetical protein
MRILWWTYGSRGAFGPMVGLAVHLRALGAEKSNENVATGVPPTGSCR